MFIDEPDVDVVHGVGVADFVLARVNELLFKAAVVDADGGQVRNYSEISGDVERQTARLRSFGIDAGDVVAVVSEDLFESACIALAAMRIGASFWLADEWPRRESDPTQALSAGVIDAVRPNFVLVDEGLVPAAETAMARVARALPEFVVPPVFDRGSWGHGSDGAAGDFEPVAVPIQTDARVVAHVALADHRPTHWPVNVGNEDMLTAIARACTVLRITEDTVGLLAPGLRIERYRLLLLLLSMWAHGATAVIARTTEADPLLEMVHAHSVSWLCAGEKAPFFPPGPFKPQALGLDDFNLSALETLYVIDRSRKRPEVEEAFGCDVLDGAWPTYETEQKSVLHMPRWEMERDLSPARYRSWHEGQRGFIHPPLGAKIEVDADAFQNLMEQLFASRPELATEERKADAWRKSLRLHLVGEDADESAAFAKGLLEVATEIGLEHRHWTRLQGFLDDHRRISNDLSYTESFRERIVLEVADESFTFARTDFWQLLTWSSGRGQFADSVAEILATRRLSVGDRYHLELRSSANFCLRGSVPITEAGKDELERMRDWLRALQSSPERLAIRDRWVTPFYLQAHVQSLLRSDTAERRVWLSEFASACAELDEPTALKLLDSQNWRGRRVAAWMVAYRDWKQFSPLLIDRFHEGVTHTVGALALGIALLAEPAAAEELCDYLDQGVDEQPNWQLAAAALVELDRVHGTAHAERYLGAGAMFKRWQDEQRVRYPNIPPRDLPVLGDVVDLLRHTREQHL